MKEAQFAFITNEVGSGFPLLVIPGGGINATVAGLATHPFNPFDEFKGEFRVIAADLVCIPRGCDFIRLGSRFRG
jgi:hypothetical protein